MHSYPATADVEHHNREYVLHWIPLPAARRSWACLAVELEAGVGIAQRLGASTRVAVPLYTSDVQQRVASSSDQGITQHAAHAEQQSGWGKTGCECGSGAAMSDP